MFVLQGSNVLRASILTIFVVIVVVALSLFAKGPPGTDSLSIETNPRIASSGVGERRDLGGVEGSISLNVDPVVVNKADRRIPPHDFMSGQSCVHVPLQCSCIIPVRREAPNSCVLRRKLKKKQ